MVAALVAVTKELELVVVVMLLEDVSRENEQTRYLKFQEIFYPTENVT